VSPAATWMLDSSDVTAAGGYDGRWASYRGELAKPDCAVLARAGVVMVRLVVVVVMVTGAESNLVYARQLDSRKGIVFQN
jgi:hypothetical protein